jgi:hypothetical protein
MVSLLLPEQLTNGTGQAGRIHTRKRPEGGQLGSASLTVTGNAVQCHQSIDITSGTADLNQFPRTISAGTRPSVTAYSYFKQ